MQEYAEGEDMSPRLNIEDCWWSDPRRSAMLTALGGSEVEVDGTVVKLWRLAQHHWGRGRGLVPPGLFKLMPHYQLLIDVGLAREDDGGVYVCGSADYLDWLNSKVEAGRTGGKISAQRPRDAQGRLLSGESKQNPSKTKGHQTSSSSSSSFSNSISISNSQIPYGEPLKNAGGVQAGKGKASGGVGSATFEAYAGAYEARYGVQPVRNAKVNSQLIQLVNRLGSEEAPLVAAFFVTHHADQFYLRAKHSIDLLLRDAEKLRTEWATGRASNSIEARQAEQKVQILDAFGLDAEGQVRGRAR